MWKEGLSDIAVFVLFPEHHINVVPGSVQLMKERLSPLLEAAVAEAASRVSLCTLHCSFYYCYTRFTYNFLFSQFSVTLWLV